MKTRLTVGIVWAVLAGTLTFVAASSIKRDGVSQGAHRNEVIESDAPAGEVLPATTLVSNAPNYVRGPRIIHVPQPEDDHASVDAHEAPEYTDEDDNEAVSQPRRRGAPVQREVPRMVPRTTPRWGMHNGKTPPAAAPRRAVLSAPPLADGPSPMKPTPRFGAKAEMGEKFGPPRPISSSAPPPPVGYKPPDAVPSSD